MILDTSCKNKVIAWRGPHTAVIRGKAPRNNEVNDLAKTIALAPRFPEYQFHATIAPLERENGSIEYPTPA